VRELKLQDPDRKSWRQNRKRTTTSCGELGVVLIVSQALNPEPSLMPDRRQHRGPHPEDVRLFDLQAQRTLRLAAADFHWLLDHGYPHDSALKLVGDRYALVARQRIAVSRCSCSNAAAARRRRGQLNGGQLRGAILWIDGYNVLTTIEAALAGGVILAARDGTYRDMASMHGSYRKVAETLPALELLGHTIAALEVAECRWFLDAPVSNSGRLKGIIETLAAARAWPWRAELVPAPDILLAGRGAATEPTQRHPGATDPERAAPTSIVVATADSVILDRCAAWFNLAKETVVASVPNAWVVGLDG
jgi:hypothetical protein